MIAELPKKIIAVKVDNIKPRKSRMSKKKTN